MDYSQLRLNLERELAEMEQKSSELKEASEQAERNESEVGASDDLRADVSDLQEDRTVARSELSDLIRAHKRALDRMDQGVYESCERCGKAITPERLEAKATTTHCIDCQRELEAGRE